MAWSPLPVDSISLSIGETPRVYTVQAHKKYAYRGRRFCARILTHDAPVLRFSRRKRDLAGGMTPPLLVAGARPPVSFPQSAALSPLRKRRGRPKKVSLVYEGGGRRKAVGGRKRTAQSSGWPLCTIPTLVSLHAFALQNPSGSRICFLFVLKIGFLCCFRACGVQNLHKWVSFIMFAPAFGGGKHKIIVNAGGGQNPSLALVLTRDFWYTDSIRN